MPKRPKQIFIQDERVRKYVVFKPIGGYYLTPHFNDDCRDFYLLPGEDTKSVPFDSSIRVSVELQPIYPPLLTKKGKPHRFICDYTGTPIGWFTRILIASADDAAMERRIDFTYYRSAHERYEHWVKHINNCGLITIETCYLLGLHNW